MLTIALRYLLPLVMMLTGQAARAADPSVLWKIVHEQCVPNERNRHDPQPCALVAIAGGEQTGYAILKDKVGIAQFLLIPTARNSGIDDPGILAAGMPNFWDLAWQARRFTVARAGSTLPRDALSLAINSSVGRSQDQLHIHIDCVRPDVRAAIARHASEIGSSWAIFPVPLSGHRYRAMRVEQETLNDVNPFHLLAGRDPKIIAELGLHTLVVVGATFGDKEGFVVFDDVANRPAGDFASGEELQDHDCKLAR
jgi:CDP-diacylglycerol pyrophosphatase